jgi:hypothetical protein
VCHQGEGGREGGKEGEREGGREGTYDSVGVVGEEGTLRLPVHDLIRGGIDALHLVVDDTLVGERGLGGREGGREGRDAGRGEGAGGRAGGRERGRAGGRVGGRAGGRDLLVLKLQVPALLL